MDSRSLFQFRFVDRFDSKDRIIRFIGAPSKGEALWVYGPRGTGKTRLIKKVLSENLADNQRSIIFSFDSSSETIELQRFLEKLQEVSTIRFIDFLRTNYTSLLDISKQVTTQLLKNAGIDISGFISAAYDGAQLFISKETQQQHSASKVIELYVNTILHQYSLVIALDHFSSCKKQSVDLFVQFIGRFIENPNMHFLICTTDEDLCNREDIQTKLLTKIAVTRLELKPFDDDIYFYEILKDIFNISRSERNVITQVFSICNGLPDKLQLALMELYRTNAIELNEDRAKLDLSEMKRYLLQKKVGFKLNSYNISAKILLWLVIAFDECATPQLLRHSAEFLIKKVFMGMDILVQNLDQELKNLFQGNVIDIEFERKGAVRIGNLFVRETLKEQFTTEPARRLFSSALVSYFSDEASFLESLDLESDWKKKIVVTHAINAQVSGWVHIALEHGLHQYSKGFITDAADIFVRIQQENDKISSVNLLKMANCFYMAGKYCSAESVMQLIESRQNLDNWEFHFCYSRILNLLLKKEDAVRETRIAIRKAKTVKEHIQALNMQQQILVDTSDGHSEAKDIFFSLIRQLRKTPHVRHYILPTLKTAVDFCHGADSFMYLKEAEKIAREDNNQLELAYVLTNEGFEYFRQGQVHSAEQCFVESLRLLENMRIHEVSYPLCDLANCYMVKEMYEQAISVLLRAALWNQSNYVFITIQTLLMVCYAFLGQDKKSKQIANDLVLYIDTYKITDTTMLRKIYLNMAIIYRYLEEPILEEKYAEMAYPLSIHTSSWYRAYEIAQPYMQNLSTPIQYCPLGEEWYWTNARYDHWLVTFSHD